VAGTLTLFFDLHKLWIDDPNVDCTVHLSVRVGDGSGYSVVSFVQHGFMLAGLSAKEGVISCLGIARYVIVVINTPKCLAARPVNVSGAK
jgi:hypothetical protein